MISEKSLKRMTKSEIGALLYDHNPYFLIFGGIKNYTKEELMRLCWLYQLTDFNPDEGLEFIAA